MIRAATVQFMHRPGELTYNLGRIDFFCAKAVARDARIVVFPEMCITGYWHVRKLDRKELLGLAERVPEGRSSQHLLELSRRLGLVIGAGLIELAEDGRLFNSYLVAEPDGALHRHRKLHAFESPYIESGDSYTVFDSSVGCRLGVLICYDNNIFENVRITSLMGAQILLAPHQTGGCRSKSPHALGAIDPALWHNRAVDPEAIERELRGPKGREWLLRWLPSRAHDNALFVLFSNGVGIDDDEVRTGNAMIIDCYGRILAETWKADDDMVTADLDLDLIEGSTGRLWMRARRPRLYASLAQPTGLEVDPRTAKALE